MLTREHNGARHVGNRLPGGTVSAHHLSAMPVVRVTGLA
jgi:hypothetical protein